MVYAQLPAKMLPTIDFETLPVRGLYSSHQRQPDIFTLNAVVAEEPEYLPPTVHRIAGDVKSRNVNINGGTSKHLGVSTSVRNFSERETTTKTGEGAHCLGMVFDNMGRVLNATLALFESAHEYKLANQKKNPSGSSQAGTNDSSVS